MVSDIWDVIKMGNFCPVFLAFAQYCCGIYIFKRPVFDSSGPLLSSFLVLLSMFFVLWDLILYPNALRKLWWCGDFFIQYIVSVFIIEHFMACFWFPLEIKVIKLLPLAADYSEELLHKQSWKCDFVCNSIRNRITSIIISNVLSLLILLSTLHATRAVDLRLLRCGPLALYHDIAGRIKRLANKGMKKLRKKKKSTIYDVVTTSGSYFSYNNDRLRNPYI